MVIAILKIIFVVAFVTGFTVLVIYGKAGTQEWAGLAILLVVSSSLFVFFGKDIVRVWEWVLARMKRHAYRTEERVYRFGYVQVRMLMTGPIPWFSAADVGHALGIPGIDGKARELDVTEWEEMGSRKELYLSEAAVMQFIDQSQDANRQQFKIWFIREVMSPLHRARERQQQERKAKLNAQR